MNAILSPEYAMQAYNTYQYDEAMYSRYVHTARILSKEEYDPDGDGHFNLVEDVIKEFKGYNDNELGDVYAGMDPEQRRMLAFDGVDTREKFVAYTRQKTKEYDEANSGF